MKKKKGLLGGVGLAVIIAAGLICIAKCTVRVPAGYVAVEYNFKRYSSTGMEFDFTYSKNITVFNWY